MKHPKSVSRLIKEVSVFLEVISHNIQTGENQQLIILKTGDVLGALEVFTFANFTDTEQEIIFSRARNKIEDTHEQEMATTLGKET